MQDLLKPSEALPWPLPPTTPKPTTPLRPHPRAQVTIQWLPSGLVKWILEIAVHGLGICSPHRSPNAEPTRYSILCAANSTRKAWECAARALLWKDMFIREDARAQLLLFSPALGKYKTPHLHLSGLRGDLLLAARSWPRWRESEASVLRKWARWSHLTLQSWVYQISKVWSFALPWLSIFENGCWCLWINRS